MQKPLISIITVVFNSVSLIEQTIQNIINQSYSHFEFIVIDGGSTDGTLSIIEKYKEDITHLISEKDTGIYNAMNKGVKLSTAHYCLFLNSGDLLASTDTLSIISKDLENGSNDIVYGDVITLKSNGEKFLKLAELPCNKHRMYFCHQSAFIKTKCLRKFPYDEKYKMSADFKFFKTCYLNNLKFKYVNIPVAIYNLYGISNLRRIEGLKENIKIIMEADKGFERVRLIFRILPSYTAKNISNLFKPVK